MGAAMFVDRFHFTMVSMVTADAVFGESSSPTGTCAASGVSAGNEVNNENNLEPSFKSFRLLLISKRI